MQRTRDDYWKSLQRYCADWLDRPLVEITTHAAHARHVQIGTQNGKYESVTVIWFHWATGGHEGERVRLPASRRQPGRKVSYIPVAPEATCWCKQLCNHSSCTPLLLS